MLSASLPFPLPPFLRIYVSLFVAFIFLSVSYFHCCLPRSLLGRVLFLLCAYHVVVFQLSFLFTYIDYRAMATNGSTWCFFGQKRMYLKTIAAESVVGRI